MRETTKWLIAATAAVAAVLVAGLQLKDLPHGFWATSMALLGVAAALVAVVFILYRAAGVLSAGYTTFGSILDLDDAEEYKAGQRKALSLAARIAEITKRKAEKGKTGLPTKPAGTDQPRGALPDEASKEAPEKASPTKPPGWLRRISLPVLCRFSFIVIPVMKKAQKRALLRARDEGVRIRELIDHLNQDSFYFTQSLAGDIYDLNDELRKTDKDIIRLRGELIGKPSSSGASAPASDGHASARAQLTEAEWRQNRLESATSVLIAFANQMLLEQRFRKLLSAIFLGGAVIALGVGAFVVAPKLGKPQTLSITQPTQVTIRVVKDLGKSCKPGTLLQGVAVGGTWAEPIVVTEEKDGCPAQEVTLDKGQAVAVPVLEPAPSPSATPSR